MKVGLEPAPFDALDALKEYRSAVGGAGKSGASCVFIGAMRDFNEGEEVQGMYLEHYAGMTEKHLEQICARAQERWPILDCLLLHRTGEVTPGDDIVLVATWAAHRGDALDATRFIIEDLKHKAPFWKKEKLKNGERWVERNTSGYAAR